MEGPSPVPAQEVKMTKEEVEAELCKRIQKFQLQLQAINKQHVCASQKGPQDVREPASGTAERKEEDNPNSAMEDKDDEMPTLEPQIDLQSEQRADEQLQGQRKGAGNGSAKTLAKRKGKSSEATTLRRSERLQKPSPS